jgi:LysW-gamma-L-lysine carboxypeptidase
LQNYPVELLKSMLKIYSPSGSERQLADFLREWMSARGFSVRRDHVGNVIGELGDEGPRILVCGHMDTVPGEIPVRSEGDFLYGRGAVDAKSSLAAMIAGGSLAIEHSPIPFRLTLACVVEEETSSAGAKALVSSGNSYDLAVFGEPSGASSIVIGYKGSVQLQVTCMTGGGHSASPWLSKNSYEEAFEFWRIFRDSLLENDSPSKFLAVTGCVTNAIAGDATNNIPSQARLVINVRIPPNMTTGDMVKRVEEFVEHYQKNRRDVRFLITVKDRTEAFLGNEDSITVRAFRWAIRKTTGCQVSLVKKTGTSDMNILAESYSIPMIAYGPGDSSLDHTENERVSIRDYLSSVEVYASAIQQIALLTHNKTSLPHAVQ